MSKRRRQFRRRLGQRRYRRLFILAVEGEKTEPQYFEIFNDQQFQIQVECLFKRHRSSPDKVLRRIKDRLKNVSLKKTDEAWVVVDKDQWTDEQLAQIHDWSQEKENFGFALSNPNFEYWILLHFEDGNGISRSRDCSDRLRKYLKDYDGGIDPRKITKDMITAAIQRARQRDHPPCTDWPKGIGTTVYKLVEKFIEQSSEITNKP